MRNGPPIDNWYNPGYNIVDFTAFAPEYGSREDFSDFMQQAHALGIKVILDITPNHSGRNHPWAVHARTYGEDSPYWSWYEHTIIPHNTNGLGQSVDAYGFTYYSGFSEQLLNLNWKDIDLQREMVRAYLYWVKEFGVDGFRHDVYWGPHRRYGEQFMGKPLRDALKHVKPDILLLGEDDGTGSGTEVIYADWLTGGINGGVDAAYDFKLYFNQIRGFGFSPAAITGLHGELDNGGFYPGENALYMRFMESQDEDRITYFYSGAFTLDSETAFKRTMPMATVIFTAPGFPMLWNGQEVGWGYGITGQKENRNRSVIDWDYEGRTLLSPHYQKLATLRGQFPAFTQHKRDTNGDGGVTAADSSDFLRVASSNSAVYAFARPWSGQNGLTVANFAATEQTASLNLWTPGVLLFPWVVESSNLLWVNNLTEGTWTQVRADDLSALVVTLPAYGSAVYTVSASRDTLRVQNPITGVGAPQGTRPEEFLLEQNYPNPFNPVTTIRFSLPDAGDVELGVFDLLGREVDRLQAGRLEAGAHTLQWDGRSRSGLPLSSGVYLYRLVHRSTAGKEQTLSRAMILLR
jgi:glycosidase